ncbi:hypothetical protein QA861_03935 [Streptomyces sp. B21-083]
MRDGADGSPELAAELQQLVKTRYAAHSAHAYPRAPSTSSTPCPRPRAARPSATCCANADAPNSPPPRSHLDRHRTPARRATRPRPVAVAQPTERRNALDVRRHGRLRTDRTDQPQKFGRCGATSPRTDRGGRADRRLPRAQRAFRRPCRGSHHRRGPVRGPSGEDRPDRRRRLLRNSGTSCWTGSVQDRAQPSLLPQLSARRKGRFRHPTKARRPGRASRRARQMRRPRRRPLDTCGGRSPGKRGQATASRER